MSSSLNNLVRIILHSPSCTIDGTTSRYSTGRSLSCSCWLSTLSIHRKFGSRINRGLHIRTFCSKCCKLFFRHLRNFIQLCILICSDELFNDHKSSTNTNNELTIKDLSEDLLCTKQIEAITNLSYGNKAIGLIDVLAKHLIKKITLWQLENWSLLFISDFFVHYFNNLIFIFQKKLDFFDVINLLGNFLRKSIKSINKQFFILSESFNISFISLNMSIEIGNLTCLQLNLFVKFNSLLSNHGQLSSLIYNDGLSFFQGEVDFSNLFLNFLDLLFSIFNHLITVLDLVMEMTCKLILLSLVEIFLEKLLSLLKKFGLLVADVSEGLQELKDLFEILLGLFTLCSHISNEQLQLAGPLSMGVLQLLVEFNPLLLNSSKLILGFFNL